jgi:uncharacterized protein YcgI (DUF1989 family)
MNLNLFSRVEVANDGSMHFIANNAPAGSFIELRAEMNTLVVLNTCQHPMDPDPVYQSNAVELEIKRVPTPAADDLCRQFRPENARGFTLTERYFL